MKDLKNNNMMLQELSQEEAVNTYGGAAAVKYIALVKVSNSRIAMVVSAGPKAK